MKPVFLFPGQGSQHVGMGQLMHREFPIVREVFAEASEILRVDVAKLCFEGPEATLQRTDNAQPAVTVVSIACLRALSAVGIEPVAAAGHSLGEYAALHAAGALSFRAVIELVRVRGRLMQAAADENPGGMIALIGLNRERVVGICDEASRRGTLSVANYNSPTQTVLTGVKAALDEATVLAKKTGPVLVVPLKVSGPWHSPLLQPAAAAMAAELASRDVRAPAIPVVANVTGDFFVSSEDVRQRLVEQIVHPVQWSTSIERLISDGHRIFVEVGPGHMLAGLMREIDKSVRVFTTEKPEDIAKLHSHITQS